MLAPVLAALLSAAPTPEALAILERHQCHRCHEVEGLAAPPKEKSCAGCHRDTAAAANDPARMEIGRKEYGPAWDRFVDRTAGRYVSIPPLVAMGRFRAAWLRAFLRAPFDLRPNLGESMPRHNLSDAEVDLLVAGWGAEPEPAPPQRPPLARLRAGETVFHEKSCGACHLLGNRVFEIGGDTQFLFLPRLRDRALAPDLRHARQRLSRPAIVRLLLDPRSLNPASEMPRPESGMNPAEAELLADFVLFAEPGKPRPRPHRAPAKTDGPTPAYEEVEAKVFKFVCWHCHSDPDFAGGDGGPGNTGGLGFGKLGLSFASYEDVLNGSLSADGKRQSIFRPGESGEPVLLERLRRRYLENDHDFRLPGEDDGKDHRRARETKPRGMPLGLPALTDEQFSVVERWVKGGHPGPKGDAAADGEPAPMGIR